MELREPELRLGWVRDKSNGREERDALGGWERRVGFCRDRRTEMQSRLQHSKHLVLSLKYTPGLYFLVTELAHRFLRWAGSLRPLVEFFEKAFM